MAYVEGLVSGLKDEDSEVGMRVANALKELEDSQATLPLIEALRDPCEEVRRAAAWALSWVGDERAQPALIRALEDGSDSVRLWAASGLQGVGDESAVMALIEALTDSYESVRMHAVLALTEIGDRRAVEPLLDVLDDEDPYVQDAVRDNLRDTFGVDVGCGYVEAARRLSDQSARQYKLNRRLEKVLNVIGRLRGESGEVLDEDLCRILSVEHGINEDETLDLVVGLLRAGLVYIPKLGYTRISV